MTILHVVLGFPKDVRTLSSLHHQLHLRKLLGQLIFNLAVGWEVNKFPIVRNKFGTLDQP